MSPECGVLAELPAALLYSGYAVRVDAHFHFLPVFLCRVCPFSMPADHSLCKIMKIHKSPSQFPWSFHVPSLEPSDQGCEPALSEA